MVPKLTVCRIITLSLNLLHPTGLRLSESFSVLPPHCTSIIMVYQAITQVICPMFLAGHGFTIPHSVSNTFFRSFSKDACIPRSKIHSFLYCAQSQPWQSTCTNNYKYTEMFGNKIYMWRNHLDSKTLESLPMALSPPPSPTSPAQHESPCPLPT